MSQIKVNSIVPVGGLPSGANGGIIQSIFTSTTSETSTTGTSYVDTGITATITPQSNSSKILVLASFQVQLFRSASETGAAIQLMRGSTVISKRDQELHAEADTTSQSRIIFRYIHSLNFLDSPATTSATTYKIQMANTHSGNSPSVTVNRQTSPGCLTLLEIST